MQLKLLVISSLFGLFFSNIALAGEVNVSLKATVNDNPAFQAVKWRIFRFDDAQSPILTGSRHSMSFRMKPGVYKLEATMGSVKKKKEFTVSGNVNREIIVAMDD